MPCIILSSAQVPSSLCIFSFSFVLQVIIMKSSSCLSFWIKLIDIQMAQVAENPNEEVVLGEEIGHVRVITLNQPRRLNVISSDVVALLAKLLEKWEKDDEAELILIKVGPQFPHSLAQSFPCFLRDLGVLLSLRGSEMFYDGRTSKDSNLEVVYRMYWLCYHIHTYKKEVALVHGISMGGGASLMAPMKFSVVTEKTVFATPEASIGFHTDCGFSYMLSRLPGHLGEFLGLTGTRLNGAELVAAGLATHFVPSEKLAELEKRLISLNSGDENAVKSAIEEFSVNVQIDENSVLHKKTIIDECFSKDSVEEIITSFEAEASKEGNGWILTFLKGLKRSSPTALKITLQSIREGRKQTLSECLKKEFRITMNILRSVISPDVYEGIRAVTIDKDNAPKWDPPTLESVDAEKVNQVFQPFEQAFELKIPTGDYSRWEGKYEDSPYATSK
ncbi:UNVERIFIED_CONTAM: 3-hydroxyisobutyryl-CoA hydrolase-like protein 5 [Sesamum latifolium]|uniref:3-hydroxyisobutyryl-CoA hydrolase n=1 Tax=Sesamum latifolium TaxID=2727402 RepID=A0AAW2WPT6_9LAMI